MSTIGLPTLLDLAKVEAGIDFDIVDETTRRAPELRLIPGRTIRGRSVTLTIRTDLPTVGFRNVNEGVARSKATHEERVFQTYLLDQQIAVDKAAIREEIDPERYLVEHQMSHLEAAFRTVSRQTYYGTGNDAKGFPGLLAQYDTSNEVDATGSTAKTSAWMLHIGAGTCSYIFGDAAIPTVTAWQDQTLYDASNRAFSGLECFIQGSVGFQLANRNAAVRVKNIGTDTNKGLTDSLLYDALEKFTTKFELEPTHIFMNGRSQEQLRKSRTNTGSNVKGEVPPLPDDWYGIPIVRTFGISNAEA
jgi:hypothetical protein